MTSYWHCVTWRHTYKRNWVWKGCGELCPRWRNQQVAATKCGLWELFGDRVDFQALSAPAQVRNAAVFRNWKYCFSLVDQHAIGSCSSAPWVGAKWAVLLFSLQSNFSYLFARLFTIRVRFDRSAILNVRSFMESNATLRRTSTFLKNALFSEGNLPKKFRVSKEICCKPRKSTSILYDVIRI